MDNDNDTRITIIAIIAAAKWAGMCRIDSYRRICRLSFRRSAKSCCFLSQMAKMTIEVPIGTFDWGTTDKIYIYIYIKDTYCGENC